MARRKVTRDHVLDELAWLATVEHALCVDYLLLHYALRTVVRSVPEVAGAVEQAGSMAQNAEMHHLARVNRILVRGGRAPVLGRAPHLVPASGPPVALCALTPARFAAFPKGEATVAATVDTRYIRLKAAVDSSPRLFDAELLGDLSSLLGSLHDHADQVATLAGTLDGLHLADVLGDLRLEPTGGPEADLLALSNRYYRVVVHNVAASLARDEPVAGQLLSAATSTMFQLDTVNAVLVDGGLCPAFDLLGG